MTTEKTETTTETAATKKAAASARRANVAPAKGKAGKKTSPKKKAPKSARNDAREGSKTATILEMLKRPEGATAKELLKATGWQPHSLRGFLSGTFGKKMGLLTVISTKGEDGRAQLLRQSLIRNSVRSIPPLGLCLAAFLALSCGSLSNQRLIRNG